MIRHLRLLAWFLLGAGGALAQVPCGMPGVVAEALPAVAVPGQPIEVRLTNVSASAITVQTGCVYARVHAGADCTATEVTGVACAPVFTTLYPGDSHSSFWDQQDAAGLQVPEGQYSILVTYYDGAVNFPTCCVPVTIDGPLTTYCTAKASFIGCSAGISTSSPNARPVSGAGDVSVTANFVESNENGLLFASTGGPAALPFQGGILCVQPPLKRGPLQAGGGQGPTCQGVLSTVVNDGVAFPAGFDPGPGSSAWYQYWFTFRGGMNVGLSNAVQLDFL